MNLRQYLFDNRISQKAFAARVGVSQGRIQQWINGDPIPEQRCALIEIESDGQCRVEELRPDVPWVRDADDRPLIDTNAWVRPSSAEAGEPTSEPLARAG